MLSQVERDMDAGSGGVQTARETGEEKAGSGNWKISSTALAFTFIHECFLATKRLKITFSQTLK